MRYSVIHAETDEDKYAKLRELVAESTCPTIVYVSRTRRTKELALKLTRDGYKRCLLMERWIRTRRLPIRMHL